MQSGQCVSAFRLVSVQMVIGLWRQSSLFLMRSAIRDTLPLCKVLMERFSYIQMCMTYLTRFMTVWTRLFLNELPLQLVFKPFFLIMLSGKILKSGLCRSPFFTPLRTLFLCGCIARRNQAQLQQPPLPGL